MFSNLNYCVAMNKSKGKFRIGFWCFSETKSIAASSSSNFPEKSIFFEEYSHMSW